MKPRLGLVAGMLLLGALALPAPALATPVDSSLSQTAPSHAEETPAERAREIAAALVKDPVYIDPVYAPALSAKMVGEVRTKAKALGYPVYTIVLPLSPSDAFQGKERNVITLVTDALRKPGLYVVVDGGGRFPWFEVRDVPTLDWKILNAARDRALDDTGYDAGPTEVLARFYELLAGPPLPAATPKPEGTGTRPSDDSSSDGVSGGLVALGIVVAVLAILVALGLWIGLRRRGGGAGAPRREKPFSIPPHVAATVAAERRRRLTRETTAELTDLGSELAALPTVAGDGLRHQQLALDAHDAAGRVLDASRDLVDVVGAMVLLDQGRRELEIAKALAEGRKPPVVQALCAFNPLHGRASGRPTQVESDGTTVTLPLCAECRQALKRGVAPKSLPGDDGPYWHGTDLWARTFFGALGNDLPAAVSRGDYKS
ncbi:hypothetical protein EV138_3731 [Kribbella voronezhensis]|uniref:TLP18.3/Psb32/MOLO-1 phosphatase superfamily protein n=1 Tax=Kribbella voronezhensis TaxID=2512212 RepID=A0A4R7TFF8_9ACTN|nr:hypothetical protein [Kribbella voronezhensis]TDU90147.1 hypothetical protein EV138_3731 [Kribbella voronezhensis]